MTSGLRDVLEIERLRGVWDTAPSRTRDLLDLARRITGVSAPPGAQYMYGNVNVLLLDELVARVSGMSAEAFRRAVLYEPLGPGRHGGAPPRGPRGPRPRRALCAGRRGRVVARHRPPRHRGRYADHVARGPDALGAGPPGGRGRRHRRDRGHGRADAVARRHAHPLWPRPGGAALPRPDRALPQRYLSPATRPISPMSPSATWAW